MRVTKLIKDEVENKTYIKFVENKTHMGPVSEEKIARAKAAQLSAAANKVRVMADFTVKVSKDTDGDKPKSSNARSLLFTETGETPEEVAKTALYLMQAWDNKYGDQGTPDYVERLTAAIAARSEAYSKLGITPTAGKKPDLTTDQRVVYNSIVGPTGFDYYEYHLAFKLEGQTKFARSKTYRSLRPLDIKSMLGSLSKEMERLMKEISLTSRQTN
jgi:hypothetical protein